MRYTRWDEQFSTGETNEILRELAFWHLSQVLSASTERERIVSYIISDDYRSLCDFDLSYENLSALDAYHLRQSLAFYSKRADIDIGVDKEQVAVGKFRDAEELCLRTNHIFRAWSRGDFMFPPDVERVFYLAQRKIASILGDVPSLETLKPRFGPGATTQIQKRTASPRNKLGQRFCCSEELLPVVNNCIEELPGWVPFTGESDTASVSVDLHYGRLSFVPKNAKTDRAIVVEPVLNSMFQVGIGDYMANRLKRFGIDLRDQSNNQRLAREGSITGDLATLDLSSASDTVATELVAHLFPLDWFFFLSRFRSGTVEYKGELIRLQKFSSMGNGFTFPLESLIFYALASACAEKEGKVSVYGDDIIVPTSAYPLLTKVLIAAGFIPNPQKSFATGPFRESCGKDYLSGIDIRPSYVKDALSGADAFVLHNFYVRTWQPEAAAIVLKYISEPLQKWGPDGYGDGHLIGDWIPLHHKRDRGWAGYTFETYTWKQRKDFRAYPGDAILPCYTIYASPPSIGLPGLPVSYLERRNHDRGRVSLFSNSVAPSSNYDRDGRLGVVIPGRKGYKSISIYTLTT